MWAAAHLALFVLAWAAAWVYRNTPDHAPLTGMFEHWDAVLLRSIAQNGYFSPHSAANGTAFFPGYPMTLAAAHLILRNWVLSELVISGVAGCFAVVSLARLARGRRAVLYLLTAPAAIFLTVGYAECLFLAFAIPAWHAAARGRWWRAALLAGLSGLVRPDAVFLIPALAMMALTGPRGTRLVNAAKTCCAFAGPAAYEIYLTVHTGTWKAWAHAKQAGWDLHLTSPIQALKTTWWASFRHAYSAAYAFGGQLEFATMAAMLLADARVPLVAPLARGRVLRARRARARHANLVPELPTHAPGAVPGLDRSRQARSAPAVGAIRVLRRQRAARRRGGAVVPDLPVGRVRPPPPSRGPWVAEAGRSRRKICRDFLLTGAEGPRLSVPLDRVELVFEIGPQGSWPGVRGVEVISCATFRTR